METENELMEKMSLDEQRPIENDSLSSTLNDQEINSDYVENINKSNDDMQRVQYKQSNKKSKNGPQICLQRISQRVKKTDGFFWSGHMFYYTKSDPKVVTYYWRLDSQAINIFNSYRLEKNLKNIPLSSIKKALICGLRPDSVEEFINGQKCLFMLITENDTYYCGMDGSETQNTMNVLARNFYNIFKMAYLPYGNRQSK